MRVLRTEGSERKDWIPRLCTYRGQPYAILSHRWLEDANHEVLFADVQEIDRSIINGLEHLHVVKNSRYADGTASSKPGFSKLQGAARQAQTDGYQYLWIDTCCIDKSSSAELSEAINSMFKWYKAAAVCYVYLMDVSDAADTSQSSLFAASEWWKRGWTLQELLAPSQLAFFTSSWEVIGHKEFLGPIIAHITGISAEVFQEQRSVETFSIAQRMSWASGRTTTIPEDIAYCLMGLFDVNMPILYGEGDKAFIRLQQEIIKELDDESIFAWRDEPTMKSGSYSGMLATRPAAFAGSYNVDSLYGAHDRPPYSMTNKGLSITLPLNRIPSSIGGGKGEYAALLMCTHSGADNKLMGIFLKKLSSKGDQYARQGSQHWIESTNRVCEQITSIYVKQSWSGFSGFQGIHQIAADTNDSGSSICGDQDE